LHPLGQLVDGRVRRIQARYVGQDGDVRPADKAAATAQLAHLRQGISRAPGALPAIWDLTIADVPRPGNDDAPSPQERASHAAMTLYALHQQSQREPMHVPRVSLGGAVRRLVLARERAAGAPTEAAEPLPPTKVDPERERAMRRRFDALLTGTSVDEVLHHLRGLVSLLRTHGIGLDYGRLADDLERLYDRRHVDRVRLAWGRDYHAYQSSSLPADDKPGGPTPPTTTEADAQSEEDL
jgi:CRISPR system Cascade subunit CasB